MKTHREITTTLRCLWNKLPQFSLYYFMICSYVNHARLRSWNQTVSRNDGKVSCWSLMHYHTLTLYRLCTIKKHLLVQVVQQNMWSSVQQQDACDWQLNHHLLINLNQYICGWWQWLLIWLAKMYLSMSLRHWTTIM